MTINILLSLIKLSFQSGWYNGFSQYLTRQPYRADILKEFGCEKVYSEKISGVSKERPQLEKALDYLRPGDTLVVWKLSRLARSLTQVINTVKTLKREKSA